MLATATEPAFLAFATALVMVMGCTLVRVEESRTVLRLTPGSLMLTRPAGPTVNHHSTRDSFTSALC